MNSGANNNNANNIAENGRGQGLKKGSTSMVLNEIAEKKTTAGTSTFKKWLLI